MTSCQSNPAPERVESQGRTIARSYLLLLAILAVAGAVRFYRITAVGMWPDEFWSSVHLATGRGAQIFDLPSGVLIRNPPPTLLTGARPWWHIWTGLRNIVHPPLYLILLRWWMDVWGTSDLATRAFSVLASLAAIVILFDILKTHISPKAGLIAAALLAIAPAPIVLSQEARPYGLLMLLSLLTVHALLRIERFGSSVRRLWQLGICFAATALTHYFALGFLIAVAVYTAVQLRGSSRRSALLALAAATAIVVIAWGPFFWQQRHEFGVQQRWSIEAGSGFIRHFTNAEKAPAMMLWGYSGNLLNWIGPAVIAFVMPILLMRKMPIALLCWIWMVTGVGVLFAYDQAHHARLLEYPKYLSVAVPAFCILAALPIDRLKNARWIVGSLLLLALATAEIQQLQAGPDQGNGDWRGMATALGRAAGPDDPLIFYRNPFWGSPGMYYLAFANYVPDSHRPIMYLDRPADRAALSQLKGFKRIWLIGGSASADTAKWLPGWKGVSSRWFVGGGGTFAEMVPP